MILIRHGQSEFNRVFNATRVDPGIPDPPLTEIGRDQARAAAAVLSGTPVRRLVVSPYTRALETAALITERLDLPVTIDPLVCERYAMTCDIGSPREALSTRWPHLDFTHLADPWWPQTEEPEEVLASRCETFRRRMADTVWSEVAVVTHWGFIRALTGRTVRNGTVLRLDPTRPQLEPEVLFVPAEVAPGT